MLNNNNKKTVDDNESGVLVSKLVHKVNLPSCHNFLLNISLGGIFQDSAQIASSDDVVTYYMEHKSRRPPKCALFILLEASDARLFGVAFNFEFKDVMLVQTEYLSMIQHAIQTAVRNASDTHYAMLDNIRTRAEVNKTKYTLIEGEGKQTKKQLNDSELV